MPGQVCESYLRPLCLQPVAGAALCESAHVIPSSLFSCPIYHLAQWRLQMLSGKICAASLCRRQANQTDPEQLPIAQEGSTLLQTHNRACRWNKTSSNPFATQMQALVKVPLRRAHLAESIKKLCSDRQSFVDLAAFLEWLWSLTVVPERYCRQVCMWLMDKLATLQMADAMQTGQLICLLCVLCLLCLLRNRLPAMPAMPAMHPDLLLGLLCE